MVYVTAWDGLSLLLHGMAYHCCRMVTTTSSRVPEFSDLWFDILNNPVKLAPNFTG